MERLQLRYEDARNALTTLSEILDDPFSKVVRDATIQRFEYTFEAVWKFCKAYLKEKEGVVAGSPKSVFREMFQLGVLNEKETELCLEMTDCRNDTVHTYKEAVAEAIYERVPEFVVVLQKLVEAHTISKRNTFFERPEQEF